MISSLYMFKGNICLFTGGFDLHFLAFKSMAASPFQVVVVISRPRPSNAGFHIGRPEVNGHQLKWNTLRLRGPQGSLWGSNKVCTLLFGFFLGRGERGGGKFELSLRI